MRCICGARVPDGADLCLTCQREFDEGDFNPDEEEDQ